MILRLKNNTSTENFYQEQTIGMRKLFADLKESLSNEEILKELLKQVNPLQKDIESQSKIIEKQSKVIEEVKQIVTTQQENLRVQITEVVAKEMKEKQIQMEIPKYVKPILFLVGLGAHFLIGGLRGHFIFGVLFFFLFFYFYFFLFYFLFFLLFTFYFFVCFFYYSFIF